MDFVQQHKLLIGSIAVVGLIVLFIASQVVLIIVNGDSVPSPTIPREAITEGKGDSLHYVVLGDSTAVAQGSDYNEGVAIGSQRRLAENKSVTMLNYGESGARIADVADKQLPQIKSKPDVVLVLAGSNDVNHLTSKASVRDSLIKTIDGLISLNCEVKIVITGSAQMGAVDRFPYAIKRLAGWRTKQINTVFAEVSRQKQLTYADLATKTEQAFKQDPSLFASDRFHPNARGYAVWTPVLYESLNRAIDTQPSHCVKD